ncbi:MAG: hypothetical protein M0Z37_03625 [Nitrospiraceae bacterium]|nr:hypothetical protein [Nitrospiraceae bacterium]
MDPERSPVTKHLFAVSPWEIATRKVHIANTDSHAMKPAFLSDDMKDLLNQ